MNGTTFPCITHYVCKTVIGCDSSGVVCRGVGRASQVSSVGASEMVIKSRLYQWVGAFIKFVSYLDNCSVLFWQHFLKTI